VTRYTIGPLFAWDIASGVQRDPVLENGVYILYAGEGLVVDSTQKNANNRICEWQNNPVWTIVDDTCSITFGGEDNAFLLNIRLHEPGTFTTQAVVDGVESNLLTWEVR
jgi:hypothetical protein